MQFSTIHVKWYSPNRVITVVILNVQIGSVNSVDKFMQSTPMDCHSEIRQYWVSHTEAANS